ncbi:hypothetical protein C8R45DRAFT_1075322 [Mycena sanguinolenta]|nr:hypothetical protein C8R45DRAFT_1075322 [Mycena sanguinolenta]
MESFPAGTRVFFWNKTGKAIYATVEQAVRASDGTVVVHLKDDSGQRVSLPCEIRARFELNERKRCDLTAASTTSFDRTDNRSFPCLGIDLPSGEPEVSGFRKPFTFAYWKISPRQEKTREDSLRGQSQSSPLDTVPRWGLVGNSFAAAKDNLKSTSVDRFEI